MKTNVTYGFFIALGGMVLTLALYFLGFHSEASKLPAAQWIGFFGFLAIAISLIVAGQKARRSETPAEEGFSYGRGMGAGAGIAFFSALFGIATTLLYFGVINPNLVELMVQAQLDKLEAKGLSGAQIDQAEKFIRFSMKPAVMAVSNFIFIMLIGTIISLISSAFLKRPAPEVTEETPPSV